MIDPIVEHFEKLGIPLTRDRWINLNWPDGVPEPFTAEDEAMVPAQFQFADTPPTPGYVDPILEHFTRLGVTLNRERWINLNWPDGVPDPFMAEDEEQIPEQFRLENLPEPPASRAEVAAAWNAAGQHLDASELELRDAIERELANTAGLGGLRLQEANAAIKRTMGHVKRIRGAAFKKAFRHVRDETER